MKTLLVLILGLTAIGASAQSLEVVVKEVKDEKGNILVGIYKDEKTFLKTAWKGKVVKSEKGEVKIVIEDVPAGTYAISVIHDENENKELDSNMVGIPKEGFGFSNDAMGTFGPPKFDKVTVVVGSDRKPVVMKMRYM